MRTRPLRIGSAVSALAALIAALWWGTADPLRATVEGRAGLDEVVAAAAAVSAWSIVGWVALITVAAALSSLPGALGDAALRCAERITPAAARRLVHLVTGVVTVAVPCAVPVTAAGHTAPVHASSPVQPAPVPLAAMCTDPPSIGDRLPVIGRPAVAPPVVGDRKDPRVPDHEATVTGPDAGGEPVIVTVRPGDTLWGIAADHLGPDARPAEIAAEWPAWYAANRAVIGADPDVIEVGTLLRPPLDHE